jgi:hypothetical protein
MAGQDDTRDRDGQTVWLRAKTEGLMCLWMMLDTMIKNILKLRERAVAPNEMPRDSFPREERMSWHKVLGVMWRAKAHVRLHDVCQGGMTFCEGLLFIGRRLIWSTCVRTPMPDW